MHMYQPFFFYLTTLLSLCIVGCHHKQPITNPVYVECADQQAHTLQRVCVRVEGVECSSCAQDVMNYLAKIPGVQSVRLMREYNGEQAGYFVFYYPALQEFSVDEHNAYLAADGFRIEIV